MSNPHTNIESAPFSSLLHLLQRFPRRGGLRAGRPTISRKVRANLRGVEDAAPYKAAF